MRKRLYLIIAIAAGFFFHQSMSQGAYGQVAIPTAATLRPPEGFSFTGQWVCADGSAIARVQVEPRHPFRKSGSPNLESWTKIHESEAWFSGDYLIGFERDHNRLLMIDAGDPAIQSFHTDGWKEDRLTLESVSDREGQLEPVRIEYKVLGPRAFTVTWEAHTDAGWKNDPAVNCRKTDVR